MKLPKMTKGLVFRTFGYVIAFVIILYISFHWFPKIYYAPPLGFVVLVLIYEVLIRSKMKKRIKTIKQEAGKEYLPSHEAVRRAINYFNGEDGSPIDLALEVDQSFDPRKEGFFMPLKVGESNTPITVWNTTDRVTGADIWLLCPQIPNKDPAIVVNPTGASSQHYNMLPKKVEEVLNRMADKPEEMVTITERPKDEPEVIRTKTLPKTEYRIEKAKGNIK